MYNQNPCSKNSKKTGMKNMKELIQKISDTQIFDLLNKETPKSEN